MKKKLLSVLLCVMVMLNSASVTQVSASGRIEVTPDFSEEDYLESRIDNTVFEWANPTPFYDHVFSIIIGFDIFGNEAECALIIDGYSEVNKISAYINIQRYVSGKWTTIAGGSFREEANSESLYCIPYKVLSTRGTYRFTSQIFVYANDGSVEIIEKTSNTAVY